MGVMYKHAKHLQGRRLGHFIEEDYQGATDMRGPPEEILIFFGSC
jgi:hypothetical protein